MRFYEKLASLCPPGTVRENVPMDTLTTLRVGGPADYLAEPETEEQLLSLLRTAQEEEVPVLVFGNGSNLLVRDGGVAGLVIHLGKAFSVIRQEGCTLYAQAGALLSVLSRTARDAGLTGLEFAQGIPGSVGGGVYMNAGAYGGELGAVISAVRILDGERIREIPGAKMDFSYRHTNAMLRHWLILGASFALQPGDPEAIDAAMRDYASRRREKQPLEYPSAGSFFKRPAGYFAGRLIEDAGLKGVSVGGAQVSPKHAGFLINTGGATADDFLRLMEKVQQTVFREFGVSLEPEVRIVGRDP